MPIADSCEQDKENSMIETQLRERAETPALPFQEVNQTEVDSLVDMLYAQRLVSNNGSVLTSSEERVQQLVQPYGPQEIFMTFTRAYVRLFFAPLFLFVRR